MFPASLAISVHVPDDTMVTVRPDTVHTDVVDDVITGVTVEVAEATTLKVVADHARLSGSGNVMVFDAF